MPFDFDRIIDRRRTHCSKWDKMESLYGVSPEDGISMWVADMDFLPPPAVNEALSQAIAHGIHGYWADPQDFFAANRNWMKRRHGWQIDDGWITLMPGIVSAVNIAIQAYCSPGDSIVLQTPVYHPFAHAIRNNGCRVISNKLQKVQGKYRMDMEDLAAQVDAKTRMLILCSPHNPGGRVWQEEELRQLAEFCLDRKILIVSDEIHHDLVFKPHKHTVLATLSPEIAERTITCTAASKTFNLAGGMTGSVIISNPELRRIYRRQQERCGLGSPNRFGPLMTTAAYDEGEPWLEELLIYLAANRDLLSTGVSEAVEGAEVMPLEGTYLSWIDFSGTRLSREAVAEKVLKDARIAVNQGPTFGPGGDSYLRFNIACPKSLIEQAVSRLKQAFSA